MLNFIRKHKDSMVVRVLLGMITLLFILFFGSETLRRGSGSFGSVPATVNGEPISSAKLNFFAESQLDQMRQQSKGKIPESQIELIQNQVLNFLINGELLDQDVLHLGLVTSDAELIASLKKNPPFPEQKGKSGFDSDFYKKRFLPWYKNTRGTHFENDKRRELAREKIINAFAKTPAPGKAYSEPLLKAFSESRSFEIIRIPLSLLDTANTDPLPKELKNDEAEQNKTNVESVENLANELLTDWQKNISLDEKLKEKKLSKQVTRPLKLTELSQVFDGDTDPKNLKELLTLTESKAFLEKPKKIGGTLFLIKLSKLQAAEKKIDAEQIRQFEDYYSEQISDALQTAWVKNARQNATIKFRD